MSYATRTSVPVEETRMQLEKLLVKYGATKFASAWDNAAATIGFAIKDREVRIRLPFPKKASYETDRKYQQLVRSRWRSLLLVVKAKLEAVDAGISTLEREFLADILLPSGIVVGEWLAPQIAKSYSSGKMPPLLGAPN